jgi:hypothetical protein
MIASGRCLAKLMPPSALARRFSVVPRRSDAMPAADARDGDGGSVAADSVTHGRRQIDDADVGALGGRVFSQSRL